MPNHCHNDLYITPRFSGDDDILAQLQAEVQACLDFIGMSDTPPTFNFNRLIPYPAKYAQMDEEWSKLGKYGTPEFVANLAAYTAKWGVSKDGYNCGGYEWCHDHWGTKWNAYDVARRDYDGKVIVTFQTAWAPPLPVIEALAEKFPRLNITLEYFERGMEFCGCVSYRSVDDVEKWGDERKREWRSIYAGVRGG